MKNYQIAFFDLDGTLVTKDFSLPESSIRAVDNLREMGIRVAIATGRSFISAECFLKQLNISEPSIFLNGSLICDPLTAEQDVLSSMPKDMATLLIKIACQAGLSFKVHLLDGRIYKSNHFPWPGEGEHFIVGDVFQNLAEHLHEDPMKIVFFKDSEKLSKLYGKLESHPEILEKIDFFSTHELYYEATSSSTNKGAAIHTLLGRLNIPLRDAIAVGDESNDYEMIQKVGFGVSVRPGYEENHKVAQLTVDSPEKKGIEYLCQYIMGKRRDF